MSTEFSTIWLEIIRTNYKNLLVWGFYQEWTKNDDSTEAGQSQRMKILIDQMERTAKENKSIIMMGDANLCAQKWDERLFNLGAEPKSSLAQCGLENTEIGKTYLADRLKNDRTVIESALDHIDISHDQKTKKNSKKNGCKFH
jgi:hypothetical protein